jgi:integrase
VIKGCHCPRNGNEPYDVFIRVLGVPGLRFDEAAALRRRHVDVLRRRLHIEESLAEVGGRFVFGPTKSHATRWVPLSSVLAQALERHLDVDLGRSGLAPTV